MRPHLVERMYGEYEEVDVDRIDYEKVIDVKTGRCLFRTIMVDDEAPQILRYFFTYLIPIGLPAHTISIGNVDDVIKSLKRYFGLD